MTLRKLFLVGLVCAFLAPNSAFADTPQFSFKKDNVYGSINAGTTILNDIDFGTDLNYAGVTGTLAGTSTFDAGGSISGTVGYILNELVRVEFELGYTEMDHDKTEVAGTATFTSGGSTVTVTGSGSADVSGQVEALYGMTNVLLTPLGSKSFGNGKITPLIGGGIGFVDWEDEINSITSGGTTLTVNGKESATDFASNITTGLEYSQNENLSVGIKYRHVWIDSGKNGVEDSEADNIAGTLTYRF
jgi:opacity protein-like surface antigen